LLHDKPVVRGDPSLSGRLFIFALLASSVAGYNAQAQKPQADSSSLTTSDRLEEAGWWPTKGEAARNLYVGSEACAACHGTIAALQQTTPMYHAGVRAAQSDILAKHAQLQFQEGGLSYSLSRLPAGVTYTVSGGSVSKAAPVVWAFGAGVIGQTFVLQQGDAYIEGRVSYYTSLSALDITIGHSPHPPAGVDGALGHVMDTTFARRCFSCHTTAAVISNSFAPEMATPGVQCEACHGPGAAHVSAMKAQQFKRAAATIMNPAHLAPADSVDFCGACHRTWADVVMQSSAGIDRNTVRFQPYLLENSRCWGKNGDARLTCIACHDPHQPLVRESSAYDSKCLACHSVKPRAACKVGTSHCTSCHMPKYELPQSHATFTDHFIRVVRATAVQPTNKK
jgi:hypothetical protein